MNYWFGKVAVVTGASGGIGLAISKELANYGIKVIGLARRMDKLMEAAAIIGEQKFFPIQCDIKEVHQILRTFKRIQEKFNGFDILVNNAALFSFSCVMESAAGEIQDVVNTNLLGPAILAREAMQYMRKRNSRGHIINISDIAGFFLETKTIPMGMYGPSKCGLKALGIELRREVWMAKLNIKVTTISPGFVQRDMLKQLYNFMNVSTEVLLKDRDITEIVIFVLGTPETVEIAEITVLPQGMGSKAVLL